MEVAMFSQALPEKGDWRTPRSHLSEVWEHKSGLGHSLKVIHTSSPYPELALHCLTSVKATFLSLYFWYTSEAASGQSCQTGCLKQKKQGRMTQTEGLKLKLLEQEILNEVGIIF